MAAVAGAITLLGESTAIRELRGLIDQVARSKSTVLVTGESGTGKEVVARAIHAASPRAAQKFVAVNCAAIPGALLESELFGHVRGAFTDAMRDRVGLFEEASGGTLFLDEIGELELPLQAKLLRTLQDDEIRRVGDSATMRVDVRVIAATLRDLSADVATGRFREDLYYRLAVVPLAVPPLREHPEDIPALALHFAARHAVRHGLPPVELSGSVLAALQLQPWPGNIRELENVIERALVLAESPAIDVEFLGTVMRMTRTVAPAAQIAAESEDLSLAAATRDLEQRLIRRALDAATGNRTQAAKLLDISPRTLAYKMKDYGIA